MTLHVFVISWTGQHSNSLVIADALAPHVDGLTLVYSDQDDGFVMPPGYAAHRTSDREYFGGKFKACLDLCSADLMLVVTGDVSCDNWPLLGRNCRTSFTAFRDLGVWAPLVAYTSWDLSRTLLGKVADSSLNQVAQTDSIVFALSRPLVERLRRFDYRDNVYGWGIDWAAVACCYAMGLFAAIDDSVGVSHPETTTYDEGRCIAQMHDFLRQLDAHELQHYLRLHSLIRRNSPVLPPGGQLPPWCPSGGG